MVRQQHCADGQPGPCRQHQLTAAECSAVHWPPVSGCCCGTECKIQLHTGHMVLGWAVQPNCSSEWSSVGQVGREPALQHWQSRCARRHCAAAVPAWEVARLVLVLPLAGPSLLKFQEKYRQSIELFFKKYKHFMTDKLYIMASENNI
jgi:hypothetical protein